MRAAPYTFYACRRLGPLCVDPYKIDRQLEVTSGVACMQESTSAQRVRATAAHPHPGIALQAKLQALRWAGQGAEVGGAQAGAGPQAGGVPDSVEQGRQAPAARQQARPQGQGGSVHEAAQAVAAERLGPQPGGARNASPAVQRLGPQLGGTKETGSAAGELASQPGGAGDTGPTAEGKKSRVQLAEERKERMGRMLQALASSGQSVQFPGL